MTKDRAPGHTPKNLYPYNGIISQKFMNQHRNNFSFLDPEVSNEAKIMYDVSAYGTDPTTALTQIAYQLKEALAYAEGQVHDILTEKPFLPEQMGFEVLLKPESVTDTPVRMYLNKYDNTFSLFRTPGAETVTSWTLLKKNADQTFHQTILNLPCARIAYAALFAMGVTMISDEELLELEKADKVSEAQMKEKVGKNKLFNVKFNREELVMMVDYISAENESDALTKAKFHIETESKIENVKPEELSIVN